MEAGVAGVAVLAMGSNGSRIFEKCHLPLDIQDYFHYDMSSSKLFKLQDYFMVECLSENNAFSATPIVLISGIG